MILFYLIHLISQILSLLRCNKEGDTDLGDGFELLNGTEIIKAL